MKRRVQTTGATRTNILAPRWQGALQPGDTPDCFREKPRDYIVPLSFAFLTPVLGQTFLLDGDGDFILRAFQTTTLVLGFRVRWPDGNFLSDDWLDIRDVLGPLYPPKTLPAGGELQFDLQYIDPPGAGTLIGQLILRGVTRSKT